MPWDSVERDRPGNILGVIALLPIAHAGHWASYVIYAVPVIVVLGLAVKTSLAKRRMGLDSS